MRFLGLLSILAMFVFFQPFLNASDDPYLDYKIAVRKAYMKGIEEAFEFLRVQRNADIPQSGYWVMKDVSGKPLKDITLYAIFARERGTNPVLLVDKISGRQYLVFESVGSPVEAKQIQNRLEPLKTFVQRIIDTRHFAKAIVAPGERVQCGKIEVSIDGIIQLLETAETLVNQLAQRIDVLNSKKAIRDLNDILQRLERVKQNYIETKRQLENL